MPRLFIGASGFSVREYEQEPSLGGKGHKRSTDLYMTKRSIRLNKDLAESLKFHCLNNADDLCNDAQMLLTFRKYARVLSLSILSMEELAKYSILFLACNLKADSKQWDEISKIYYSHYEKQRWFAEHLLYLYQDKTNEFKKDRYTKKKVELDKQKGFYVDIIDGHIWTPRNVTKKMAVDAYTIARREVRLFKKLTLRGRKNVNPLKLSKEALVHQNKIDADNRAIWSEIAFIMHKEIEPKHE